VRWSWKNHPAERFANSLLNHVDLLKEFAYLGKPVRGYAGVRRLLHPPLHIYYKVVPESRRVEILHIWHGARRDPQLEDDRPS